MPYSWYISLWASKGADKHEGQTRMNSTPEPEHTQAPLSPDDGDAPASLAESKPSEAETQNTHSLQDPAASEQLGAGQKPQDQQKAQTGKLTTETQSNDASHGHPTPVQQAAEVVETSLGSKTGRLHKLGKDDTSDDTQPWGLILQTPSPHSQAIGVDVRGVVVVGRSDTETGYAPELDLSSYEAQKHGISRRHALLMGTKEGLVLIDLDSTNGTWINEVSLQPGQKYRLRIGDRLEFGTLKLEVRLIGAVRTGRGDEETVVTRSKPKRGG